MAFEILKNKKEKPPVLYHGSTTFGIEKFEPRVGHTPDEQRIPRVFASKIPAWAVAHSWKWSSDEGIHLSVNDGKIIFSFPKGFNRERLNVPICIYTLPSDSFNLTITENTGETFDSKISVSPISSEKFNSVIEAIQHFGGQIIYND